jgi:hypothetical protein
VIKPQRKEFIVNRNPVLLQNSFFSSQESPQGLPCGVSTSKIKPDTLFALQYGLMNPFSDVVSSGLSSYFPVKYQGLKEFLFNQSTQIIARLWYNLSNHCPRKTMMQFSSIVLIQLTQCAYLRKPIQGNFALNNSDSDKTQQNSGGWYGSESELSWLH